MKFPSILQPLSSLCDTKELVGQDSIQMSMVYNPRWASLPTYVYNHIWAYMGETNVHLNPLDYHIISQQKMAKPFWVYDGKKKTISRQTHLIL